MAVALWCNKPVDFKGWIRVVVLAGPAWPYEAIGQPVCSMQDEHQPGAQLFCNRLAVLGNWYPPPRSLF